jgi:glycosyltransferase involved in cell wall biosynthesis
LYASSSVGLLPFFDDIPLEGGQRTKALEFFANGLLVISGPEGVKGIYGLESGKHFLIGTSVDVMCNLIEQCLSKPRKYAGIAVSGRQYISDKYSWSCLTKDYVDFVKRQMQRNPNWRSIN